MPAGQRRRGLPDRRGRGHLLGTVPRLPCRYRYNCRRWCHRQGRGGTATASSRRWERPPHHNPL